MVEVHLAVLTMALIGATPSDDPASLVARLVSGSGTTDEREVVVRNLEAIGSKSLPFLVAALGSPDPQVRSRVLATWERIQKREMVRPTLVKLDPRGQTITEVVRSVAEQSGLPLAFSGNDGERLIQGREPLTVPFWEALDRIGLVGERSRGGSSGGLRFPILELTETGDGCPTSTWGLARIRLLSLHDHRDLALIAARDTPPHEARFFVDLSLRIEPKVWLTQEGPAQAIEAVDDLGQSLLRREPQPVEADHSRFSNGEGVTDGQFSLDLALPARPGRSIVRLRGSVPVALQVRRPWFALEFPLAAVKGQVNTHEEVRFTIQSLEESDEAIRLGLEIRLDRDRLEKPRDGEGISSRLRFLVGHQVEIVDARGRVLDTLGGGSWGEDGLGRWDFSIEKTRKENRPLRLRYYETVRVGIDLPFSFQNIPLPR